ncbi:MAG: hypothetical protein Q9227_002860 [Pyrenula ochraceoflavens]
MLTWVSLDSQYNKDPHALPTTTLVQRALTLGIRAFDTSPYYGPAEELLGRALDTDYVRASFPRDSYLLITKVGRLAASTFDYSPPWIRHSIRRSLRRLHTRYLDVVYCHDVEFVLPVEVLEAVRELRRIRDTDHTIKYIGISGYPVNVLCDLAEMILRETGEPLDAVMSYANFTLQNTKLLSEGVPRLVDAGVDVVPNASLLGMGLLRKDGVPVGGMGDWHPAPNGLREAIDIVAEWTELQGEKLEVAAIRFGLETWMREGKAIGSSGVHLNPNPSSSGDTNHLSSSSSSLEKSSKDKLGVSVMGVSQLEELDETLRIYRSVLDGLADDLDQETGTITPSDALTDHEWSLRRRQAIRGLAKGIRGLLGEWVDFAWESPGKGFVNERTTPRLIEDEDLDVEEPEPAPGVLLTPKSEAAADIGGGEENADVEDLDMECVL